MTFTLRKYDTFFFIPDSISYGFNLKKTGSVIVFILFFFKSHFNIRY